MRGTVYDRAVNRRVQGSAIESDCVITKRVDALVRGAVGHDGSL
ncbi:hypothetical protein ACFSE0_19795 [Ochrobactrum teleogrylli]|nr:hypothetical protein [[Ochrobactrum] teleogrylli]